jgi:hypothetical protein
VTELHAALLAIGFHLRHGIWSALANLATPATVDAVT